MKSKKQTPICKSCFDELEDSSFHRLMSNYSICDKCVSSMTPIFKRFKIDEIDALSIYEYGDKVKENLYIFKGCFDIELKEIFIAPFKNELRLIYFDYVVVPLPSWHEDDEIRGFNHVEEIFKALNLPVLKVIFKTKKHKQSDQKFNERKNIINYLELRNVELIKNKKVLLVDDVCTTGSSLKACIKLLKSCDVKKIKVLVVAKRDFTNEEIKEINGAFEVLK